MTQILDKIVTNLEKVISQLESTVPAGQPFGNAHSNWSFPGLTCEDLVDYCKKIIESIKDSGSDVPGEVEAELETFIPRLQFLAKNTIPNLWGNAGQAVPAYLFTLDALQRALAPALKRDGYVEAAQKLRKLTSQLRGMESRLNGLEPRTESLSTMVERIEQANDAADQLPADLESLVEARRKLEELIRLSTIDHGRITDIKTQADALDVVLKRCANEAEGVLQRCETAYSAATSVGLAAAFTERSVALSRSMWFWIGGLVLALCAGALFGSRQLAIFSDVLKSPAVSYSVVAPQLLVSLLSIGAPIWFAWLSTKQIGQRFRLAEDYAFKASISRAYEGFRREAARHGGVFEQRLLNSALDRLDELPLRLVESDTHGSPWHELASSEPVKKTVGAFSDLGGGIKDAIRRPATGRVANSDANTSAEQSSS